MLSDNYHKPPLLIVRTLHIAVSILKLNGIADVVNGGGLDDLKQNMK